MIITIVLLLLNGQQCGDCGGKRIRGLNDNGINILKYEIFKKSKRNNTRINFFTYTHCKTTFADPCINNSFNKIGLDGEGKSKRGDHRVWNREERRLLVRNVVKFVIGGDFI